MPGRVGSWAIFSDSGLPSQGQEGKMFLGQKKGPGFKELGGKVLVTTITVSKYYLVSEGRAYHLLSTHYVPYITSTYKMSLLNNL